VSSEQGRSNLVWTHTISRRKSQTRRAKERICRMGLPMVGKKHRRETCSPESADWQLGRVPKRVQSAGGGRRCSLNHQRTKPSSAVERDQHCDSRSTLSRARDAGRFLQEAPEHRDGLRARRRAQVLFAQEANEGYLKKWIVPRWASYRLGDVKAAKGGTVVEDRASGTWQQGKIRNIMSALYSHAIRWEWTDKNPITQVC
jgi:hypothetical protein